MGGKS